MSLHMTLTKNFEKTQRIILRGHNRESNGNLFGRGLDVICDGECVVKVDIGQLKGKDRGVGTVLIPTDCYRTPRRGILGGHGQVRQCRS